MKRLVMSVVSVIRVQNKKDMLQNINDRIQSVYSAFVADSAKEIDGNKSAGARARKESLKIEKLMKEYRKLSIENSKR